MRQIKISLFLVLALLVLAGCSRSGEPSHDPKPAAPAAVQQAGLVSNVAAPEPLPQAEAQAAEPEVDQCLACHSDKQRLIDTADPEKSTSFTPQGTGWSGDLPAREPWESLLVDEKFIPTVHGQFPCTSCHGGQQSSDKDVAHTELNPNPSQGPQVVCAECHPDVGHIFENSLHATVRGFWTELDARSLPSSHPALNQMMQENCSSCHNTCGDCHVSQPKAVGGGLYEGHIFQRNTPMELGCNACHGSRVGNEYMGKNESIPADVHFAQGNMECVNCHSGNELHGEPADCKACHPGPESAVVPPPDHRYDSIQLPRCESCHPDVASGQDEVLMHQMHGSKLSCQVCHAVEYANCDGCHVGSEAKTGQPSYTLESTHFTFLIGHNPIQTYDRPYEYVPVRHVPVTPDSFAAYGTGLLADFDKMETWKYATPHTIQLKTPQTDSCNGCHQNPDLFLTADKVAPDELKANQDVIVENLPPLINSGDQIP